MIDLHIHTNYSGGQSNLKEVLQIAQRRKVSIIAITDNNTCEAYKELNNILTFIRMFIDFLASSIRAEQLINEKDIK